MIIFLFFISLSSHSESSSTLAFLSMFHLHESPLGILINQHSQVFSLPFLAQYIKMSKGQLYLDEITNHYSAQIAAPWCIENYFLLWLNVWRGHPEPYYERKYRYLSCHNLAGNFRKLMKLVWLFKMLQNQHTHTHTVCSRSSFPCHLTTSTLSPFWFIESDTVLLQSSLVLHFHLQAITSKTV